MGHPHVWLPSKNNTTALDKLKIQLKGGQFKKYLSIPSADCPCWLIKRLLGLLRPKNKLKILIK